MNGKKYDDIRYSSFTWVITYTLTYICEERAKDHSNTKADG